MKMRHTDTRDTFLPKQLCDSFDASPKTIIHPNDCVIVFGIPTCEEGFKGRRCNYGNACPSCMPASSEGWHREGRENMPIYDYIRGSLVWREYHSRFVRLLKELEPGLIDIGVTVLRYIESRHLRNLFYHYRVVILFAHWVDKHPEYPLGAVEMDDGLVGVDEIVEAVPEEWDGVLDLCMCNPANLVAALLDARPRCHLKRLNINANPVLWLYFYGTLFAHLNDRPMSYSDALASARSQLVKKEH
jgi:hypothetical protein